MGTLQETDAIFAIVEWLSNFINVNITLIEFVFVQNIVRDFVGDGEAFSSSWVTIIDIDDVLIAFFLNGAGLIVF